MKVAFDTSVIVPALVLAHPNHATAQSWLKAASAGRVDGIMAWHALMESYAVLTRLPVAPPVSPAAACKALEVLRRTLRPVAATRGIYDAAMRLAVEVEARSGAIFDALHLATAEHERCDAVLTYDASDFERLAGGTSMRIVVPSRQRPPSGT